VRSKIKIRIYFYFLRTPPEQTLVYTGKWGRTAGGWADLYAKHSEALGTKQIQSIYFTSQRRNKLRSH